jgi:hypothetical protein
MTTRKTPVYALLPTALFFGLGVGNLWGVAGLFTRLGDPDWVLAFPIVALIVLVLCLCGVARAWWSKGAVAPIFVTVVASWVFAAPWAAITGKFTVWAWALWLPVLLGCGGLALMIAWLFERQKPTDAMPNTSLERSREG